MQKKQKELQAKSVFWSKIHCSPDCQYLGKNKTTKGKCLKNKNVLILLKYDWENSLYFKQECENSNESL